jgi:hypothetical protein
MYPIEKMSGEVSSRCLAASDEPESIVLFYLFQKKNITDRHTRKCLAGCRASQATGQETGQNPV